MEELSKLITMTGMALNDFSYAIGVRYERIVRMLKGNAPTPDGVISDAHQLLADIDYVQSLVDHNPQLKKISYKVWKLVLDDRE